MENKISSKVTYCSLGGVKPLVGTVTDIPTPGDFIGVFSLKIYNIYSLQV